MSISVKIRHIMSQPSWIRKMFEEGVRLKSEYGAENVFDFSLGNPNTSPPKKFSQVLKATVNTCSRGDHAYMSREDNLKVRQAVADCLTQEQEVSVDAGHVLMTCGASGALNVIFKTLLDSGDEVLVPTPCFVEYRFYIDNHGGRAIFVPTKDDFSLNLDAMDAAITAKTKAVLINSPNNPTGQIYNQESLSALGALLEEKSNVFNRTIYLISDEPYRKIVFGQETVPSIFKAYQESILATSHSKDLSIPGERIGFTAVNPAATYCQEIMDGMNVTSRILGFVNVSALMQRVIANLQGLPVDISAYRRKRDLFCDGLAEAGYEFLTPPGAFYLFPKSPLKDDVQFVKELQKERILVVPGSGMEGPGYFRIAFCVDDKMIENALPGFKRVMDRC